MRVVSGLDKLRGRGPPEKPALHPASGTGVGGFLKPFSASEKIFPHRLRKAAVPAGSSGSGMGIFFSGRGCLVPLFVSPLGFYVSPRGGSLSDQRDP